MQRICFHSFDNGDQRSISCIRDDFHVSGRKGAGLVKDDRFDVFDSFESVSAFEKNAVFECDVIA